MRSLTWMICVLLAFAWSGTRLAAQEPMQPVDSNPTYSDPQTQPPPVTRPAPRRNAPLQVTVDGEPVPDGKNRRAKKDDDRKQEKRSKKKASKNRSDKFKAKIDSLDAELHHAGPEWQIDIKYEVEMEGRIPGDAFVLVIEFNEDQKPILDDAGEPLVMEIELTNPSDHDDDELEFEDRFSVNILKDWIRDDDDIKIKAFLIRAADGQLFDDEDESVEEGHDRRIGIGVGVGIGCGVGVGVGIGF